MRTLSNTPEVFTALDDAAIGSGNVLCRTNNREWDGLLQSTSVVGSGRVIIRLNLGLVDTDILSLNDLENALLEGGEGVLGQSIGFGDDWDQVDTRSETLHDLNVQRLETASTVVRQTLMRIKDVRETYVCPVGRMK